MPFLLIILSVVACILNAKTGLLVPAIIVAVLSFWSNGVMANFKHDPDSCPDWAPAVSMLTGLASVGLVIFALVH